MQSRLNVFIVAAALGLSMATSVHATPIKDPAATAAVQLNGGVVKTNGYINDAGSETRPWTAEIYALAGECVRVSMVSQSFDSAISILSPSGALYRDDDGNGDLRPLVMIGSAPNSGWYTVQVAHYAGQPVIDGSFLLQYGRYPAGNLNCDGAPAATAAALVSSKAGSR